MYICSRERLTNYGDIRHKAIDMDNACIQADIRPNMEGCGLYVVISKRDTNIQWVYTNIDNAVKDIIKDMVELDPSDTLDGIYQKLVKRGLHDAIVDAFIEYIVVDAPNDDYGILYLDDVPEKILEGVVDTVYDEMIDAEEEK